MSSSEIKRRFPPPWRVDKEQHGYFVRDANGITVATIYCRDDLQRFSFGQNNLTSDEARRIAMAIARLPEFLQQRHGFHSRGSGQRWHPGKPYHVAVQDDYIRAHWPHMDALCKYKRIPMNGTGERIQREGLWCVYQFQWQMDAIMFWDRFEGRWLLGEEFHYPERPVNLPRMKEIEGWPKFDPRQARG